MSVCSICVKRSWVKKKQPENALFIEVSIASASAERIRLKAHDGRLSGYPPLLKNSHLKNSHLVKLTSLVLNSARCLESLERCSDVY